MEWNPEGGEYFAALLGSDSLYTTPSKIPRLDWKIFVGVVYRWSPRFRHCLTGSLFTGSFHRWSPRFRHCLTGSLFTGSFRNWMRKRSPSKRCKLPVCAALCFLGESTKRAVTFGWRALTNVPTSLFIQLRNLLVSKPLVRYSPLPLYPSKNNSHGRSQPPIWGRQRGGHPEFFQFVPISQFSSDLFWFAILVFAICSNFLRFVPICLQNKSEQIGTTPFCRPLVLAHQKNKIFWDWRGTFAERNRPEKF